jgi:hypothetical protein
MIDRCTRAAQTPQQAIGQDLIVFCNQNAHVCLPVFLSWALCPFACFQILGDSRPSSKKLSPRARSIEIAFDATLDAFSHAISF